MNNESKKASEVEKGVKTISITESLKKAEAKNVEVRKTKDAALKAEAMLSNLGATHNLPSSVFNCLAELLPKIITDSDIVKHMSLHRSKGFYTLIHGTAPDIKKKLVKQLQLWPFTLNYDESVKGGVSAGVERELRVPRWQDPEVTPGDHQHGGGAHRGEHQ